MEAKSIPSQDLQKNQFSLCHRNPLRVEIFKFFCFLYACPERICKLDICIIKHGSKKCAGAGIFKPTVQTESFLNPDIPRDTKVLTLRYTGLTDAGVPSFSFFSFLCFM